MKAFTDISQSKKLTEILPLESADMCFNTRNNMPPLMTPYSKFNEFFNMETPDFLIPCWSLAALLDVINNNYYTTLYHDGVAWNIKIIHHDNVKDKHGVYAGTPIDACYEMIIKLNELKML